MTEKKRKAAGKGTLDPLVVRDDDEPVDTRPADDWCRAQGWEGFRDCPNPDCEDGMVDFLPCPTCGGDGIVDD
jgi:hypothetical protein